MTSNAQKKSGFLLPETIDPEASICIQFEIPDTVEYRAAARGLVLELTKWWNWEKSYEPNDTRAAQAAALFRQYLSDSYQESCDGMDCNDVVDCIEANPDYIAMQSEILSQSQTATNQHLDFLNEEYDGTPQSIGASIPTTAPDAAEENALCWTLNTFVTGYCSYKTAKIQQQNVIQIGWNRLKSAMADLYDEFSSLLGFNFGADLFACVVSDSVAISAMANSDAIIEVACHLLDYLDELIMSEAQFDSAITDAASSLTGDAGDIACLLSNNYSLDMYVQFLEWYNIAIERQAGGDTLDCPCVEPIPTLCYEVDFTGGLGDWIINDNNGQLVAGGIESTTNLNNQPAISIFIDAGEAYQWGAIELEYDWSGSSSSADNIIIRGYDTFNQAGAGTQQVNLYSENNVAAGNDIIHCIHDTSILDTAKRYLRIIMINTNAGSPETILLKRVKLMENAPPPSNIISNCEDTGCI